MDASIGESNKINSGKIKQIGEFIGKVTNKSQN